MNDKTAVGLIFLQVPPKIRQINCHIYSHEVCSVFENSVVTDGVSPALTGSISSVKHEKGITCTDRNPQIFSRCF